MPFRQSAKPLIEYWEPKTGRREWLCNLLGGHLRARTDVGDYTPVKEPEAPQKPSEAELRRQGLVVVGTQVRALVKGYVRTVFRCERCGREWLESSLDTDPHIHVVVGHYYSKMR